MTKEQETRIRVLGALAALFMVCATVAGICIDADKWAKFGRWLTDPATAVAFSALGGGLLALYLRAKASPAAGLLLALVVAGTLQGCTVGPDPVPAFAVLACVGVLVSLYLRAKASPAT